MYTHSFCHIAFGIELGITDLPSQLGELSAGAYKAAQKHCDV
jgi:hypothetical protein